MSVIKRISNLKTFYEWKDVNVDLDRFCKMYFVGNDVYFYDVTMEAFLHSVWNMFTDVIVRREREN